VKDVPGCRIVATFKDYLIYDDCSCECLKQLYSFEEAQERLGKLSQFYFDYAEIFPTYALIIQPTADENTRLRQNKEGVAKYMYKNIRRK
jgi:hypothetical protein